MKRISLFLAFVLNTSAFAATITVTNANDTGAGSLRVAIATSANGDAIVFSNTTAGGATNFYDGASHTITLATALPTVAVNLTITGPGPTGLAIARSSVANTPAFRIFTLSNGTSSGPTVTISGLTISNGSLTGTNFATGAGAGIYGDRAPLTLRNVEVTGNSAFMGGGLANNGYGGNGVITIDSCAFIGNSASAYGGGAMNFGGTITTINSTFASCSADQGGAIYSGNFGNPAASVLSLVSSTFKDNSANAGSAIFSNLNGGMDASVYVINTLFKRDTSFASGTTLEKNGGFIYSQGYNLSDDNGGGFLTASTDQINTDPKLGAVMTVAGRARFYPPSPGSPAIDKGKDSGSGKDQRGLLRPYDYSGLPNAAGGDGSDIGAVEVETPAGQQSGSTLTVTTAADYDGVCSVNNCTLREAIKATYYANVANNNAGATISFSASSAGGAVNFYAGPQVITLTSALPDLTSNITLNGPAAQLLVVQRSGAAGTPDFRIFKISSGNATAPIVTISGLTIANGKDDHGGGIYNDHGNLTLTSLVVLNNEGGAAGGGVYNIGLFYDTPAFLTIANTQFTGNSADSGGAVSNSGKNDSAASVSVSASTFTANSARSSGGALENFGNSATIDTSTFSNNSAVSGGAVYQLYGTLSVSNSRLTTNSATNRGGAIYSVGNPRTAQLTLRSSTLDGNSAPLGGGLCNEGDPGHNDGFALADISNSTFSGNSAQYGGGICNLGYYANIEDVPNVGAATHISSSTFSGNSASGTGSAIYNWGNQYDSSTIVDDGVGAGAGSFLVNSIVNQGSGTGATLVSIAANGSPGNGSPNNSIFSQGYNLSSDNGGGFLTATADQPNTNPLLAVLALNGGPTPTHAILAGSPARDKGKDTTTTHTDQRGLSRPFDYGSIPNATGGDGSDIGAFEDNDVLQTSSTLVVNTAGDSDDQFCGVTECTLREAINRANFSHSATTITFNLPGNAPQTIDLSTIADTTNGGSAFLLGSMTIQGPGANLLTIRRAASDNYRIFHVGNGASVTISGLTISNGYLASNVGGGIWNQGTLTLQSCAVNGNYANSAGGIRTEGSLTLDRCTVSGNSAFSGAGISSQTNLSGLTTVVRNSTISGNSATNYGGGLENVIGLTQISNSTITRNTAAAEGYGSGVYSHASSNTRTEVYDSIIANNVSTDLDQVSGASSYLSNGHNLVGYGTGSSAFTAAGDTRFVTNVKLGPLANNGGGTYTHALLLGSPAIDAGATASVSNDQRGLLRQSGSAVDIGAYELQPESYAFWSGYIFPTGTPANLLAADADADGDGISNGLEQVFGSNPTIRNAPSSLLQYEIQGNYLVLQFARSIYVDPAKVFAEQSLTLQPQSWSSTGITYEDMGPAGSTSELIQALIPIDGAARKFGRLR